MTEAAQYNFDLSNIDFKNYCREKGILFKAGIGRYQELAANLTVNKEIFFNEHRVTTYRGQPHTYTDAALRTHWQIILEAKNAFQDCWEQFQNLTKVTAAPEVEAPTEIETPSEAKPEAPAAEIKAAASIKEQTGWARPFPFTICQDFYALIKVTEYSFDLSNNEFNEYCRRRGILYKAGSGNRLEFTGNHSATKAQFFDEFRYAIKYKDAEPYRFTDNEMETHWRIMLAAKGALQDCWELYHNLETEIETPIKLETPAEAEAPTNIAPTHLTPEHQIALF